MAVDPGLDASLQLIARRALTLDELLAIGADLIAAGMPPAGEPSDEAVEILERWRSAYSQDDRSAFERRLNWDGRTTPLVLEQLTLALQAEFASLPAWIEPLAWVLSRPPFHGTGPTVPDAILAPDSVPFAEVWLPFARSAGEQLELEDVTRDGLLTQGAREGMEGELLRQLSRVSEEGLYGWFEGFREHVQGVMASPSVGAGSAPREIYAGFVESLRSGGLLSFFVRHPVLARQVCTLIHTWIAAEREFLERLERDLPEIEAQLLDGRAAGALLEVQAGLSDRHHGGRRVHGLRFSSGMRLIYKPRDVGTEVSFNRFLGWLEEAGLDPAPAPVRTIQREGYGWAEHVTQAPAADLEAARRYYRQAGSHLCLGYLFNGTDLHMDNVIAGSDGPILIDLELLLQPTASFDRPAEGNPLQSGYLTSLRMDPRGRIYDIGGLCGIGGHLAGVGQRVWKNGNTDSMSLDREDIHAVPEKNVLIHEGRPLMAERFAGEILDGFSKTYRLLAAQSDALLAEGGPLSWFAGLRTRFLVRDSNQYGTIIHGLLTPAFQKAGHFPGILIDTMNRGFRFEQTAPKMWPVTSHERRAIERLDVPYFTTTAGGADLVCEGETVLRGFINVTGLQIVTERLRSFGEEGLRRETRRLRAALPPVPWGTPPHLLVPLEPVRSDAQRTAPLCRAAVAVGELLRENLPGRGLPAGDLWEALRDPSPAGDPLEPFYLYDGAAGIALFFAGLARLTGLEEDRAVAMSILRGIDRAVDRAIEERAQPPIGACNGLGGILYALTCLGGMRGEQSALATGARTASMIDPRAAAERGRLDVEGGVAGAILGLLALHDASGDAALLKRARLCGDALLEHAQPGPEGGLGWVGADGVMRPGFAHGAAGIAYALVRLSAAVEGEAFLQAARKAFEFERSLYDMTVSNWPVQVVGSEGGSGSAIVMNAWCHGAPGIALSRVAVLRHLDEEAIRKDAETALLATLRADLSDKDHLCCGNMGRVDVLICSSPLLDKQELQRAASARVLVVLERALSRGSFTVPTDDTMGARCSLGFFRGFSGVGYELLRLIRPKEYPSVLMFDPPARGGS